MENVTHGIAYDQFHGAGAYAEKCRLATIRHRVNFTDGRYYLTAVALTVVER